MLTDNRRVARCDSGRLHSCFIKMARPPRLELLEKRSVLPTRLYLVVFLSLE
jgi:hypothetical protein